MSDGPTDNHSIIDDYRRAHSMGLFFCQAFAVVWEVFLHHSIGRRYIGFQAAVVLPLTFVYAAMWRRDDDLWPLLYFMLAYMLACVLHNTSRWTWLWGPEQGHSRYTGVPRLWRFLPWFSEVTIKRYLEPMAALVIGFAVGAWNAPLGIYLIFAAFCLAGACAESVAQDERRLTEMNDAVIEQRWIAERFRDQRGDRF